MKPNFACILESIFKIIVALVQHSEGKTRCLGLSIVCSHDGQLPFAHPLFSNQQKVLKGTLGHTMWFGPRDA